MDDAPLRMVGAPGSPYSRKLRAVLRYRRISHVWYTRGTPESRGLPRPRVDLLPQLILEGPDGAPEARTDTTPLIRELEGRIQGRSVVPADPVDRVTGPGRFELSEEESRRVRSPCL